MSTHKSHTPRSIAWIGGTSLSRWVHPSLFERSSLERMRAKLLVLLSVLLMMLGPLVAFGYFRNGEVAYGVAFILFGLLGASVLVSGCGPIGCLAVAAARRAGAAHITACDVVGEPLETARKLGADTVIDLGSDRSGLDALKADKGRIDMVFECSGNPAAVPPAVECVRPRGRLVAVGNGGPVSHIFETGL
mgnify:CR=1 FL=1